MIVIYVVWRCIIGVMSPVNDVCKQADNQWQEEKSEKNEIEALKTANQVPRRAIIM